MMAAPLDRVALVSAKTWVAKCENFIGAVSSTELSVIVGGRHPDFSAGRELGVPGARSSFLARQQ